MVSLNEETTARKERFSSNVFTPFLFFAPLENKQRSLISNTWVKPEIEEAKLFLDLETHGYFQRYVHFGCGLVNALFIVGTDREPETVEKWLQEIFRENKEFEGLTFVVFPLEQYFDYVYGFSGYIIGANPLFDLSRGITSYDTKDRKYPSLIRKGHTIEVNDRGYGKMIRKYTTETKVGKRLKKSKATVKTKIYSASVLDVLQLAAGLTGKRESLKEAGEAVNANIQKIDHPYELIAFDKLTLEYMLFDVLATKSAYDKLFTIFNKDQTLINSIVSPASVGKYVLRMCGVTKPFIEHKEKPRLYEAYFGGRSEVNFRGMSEKELFNTDFNAQYPVLQIVLSLQRFTLSEAIKCVDRSEDKELHKKLEEITLNDLKEPELWKELSGLILKITTAKARIPVRIKYRNSVNIQLPFVTTSVPMWYSVYDYLAARLYAEEEGSGNIEIIEIKEYIAGKRQTGLRNYEIFGISIKPETMFLDLLRYRFELKDKLKKETQKIERQRLKELIYGVKLILNATSYGATIERNETRTVKHYSYVTSDGMELKANTKLVEGRYNCPIVGVQITGSARLLVAITEVLELQNNGKRLPYIDTDGESSVTATDKIEFFEKFFPIKDIPYLAYDDEKKSFFHGLAPKRYIKIHDGKIWVKGMRTHGLGSYPSFLKKAEEVFSEYLELKAPTSEIEGFLSLLAITKIRTQTSTDLKAAQDKCSWIKPYSFGFASIPGFYTFTDLKGNGVRKYNETLDGIDNKDVEILIRGGEVLRHKAIRDNYFGYLANKYDVKPEGWNLIPEITLSRHIKYISKLSNQAMAEKPDTYISEKEKDLRKVDKKKKNRQEVAKWVYLAGIKNIQKEGVGKNIGKRGVSKKKMAWIMEEIRKLEEERKK